MNKMKRSKIYLACTEQFFLVLEILHWIALFKCGRSLLANFHAQRASARSGTPFAGGFHVQISISHILYESHILTQVLWNFYTFLYIAFCGWALHSAWSNKTTGLLLVEVSSVTSLWFLKQALCDLSAHSCMRMACLSHNMLSLWYPHLSNHCQKWGQESIIRLV